MSSCTATRYQVFLSFRGIDTRCNFISFLYNALVDRKIRTFKDDEELETGERISSELNRAIEDSKIAVVVVSVNYTESPWCLDELVKIMDLEKKKIIVMPIFYGVEPCHLRWQTESVAEHFKKHVDGVNDSERVSSWRRALTDLANLSGELSSKWNDDAKLVNGIADKILKDPRIVTTSSNQRQLVGNGKHMKEIEGLLDLNSNEDSRVVGIWAIGCKNRWALATNVYHNFSQHFDNHCFLEDVAKIPQGNILKDLHEELAKSSKKNQKVMLVANNINKVEQFEALVEEFNLFGPGSVFIITTQERQQLNSFGIKHVYDQELLRYQEVLPDRSIAFKKSNNVLCLEEKEEVKTQETESLDLIAYFSTSELVQRALEDCRKFTEGVRWWGGGDVRREMEA